MRRSLLIFLAALLVGVRLLAAHGQAAPTGEWATFAPPVIPEGAVHAVWLNEERRTLWVGGEGGLSRYDGHAWQTVAPPDGGQMEVWALSGDAEGGLWIGTNRGLGHYGAGGDWQWLALEEGLPNIQIKSLALDGEGGLWVGTFEGLARVLTSADTYQVQVVTATERVVWKILPVRDGGVLFSVGGEITHILPDATVVKQYGEADGLGEGRVQALARDGRDHLWAGSTEGLYRLTGGRFQPVRLTTGSDGEQPDVLAMVPDGEDGLWLGTARGLWHVDAEGRAVDNSPIRAAEDRLVADRVEAVARMADGTLWLGTSGGLNRWNPEAWRDLTSDGAVRHPLAAQGDRMWVVANEGLEVWLGEEWAPVAADSGPWPDAEAELTWFGNIYGNVSEERYGEAAAQVIKASYGVAIDDYRPKAIAGAAGGLWLATERGAVTLTGDQPCIYGPADGLPSDLILALHVEPEAVWVGTDLGLGLGRRGAGEACEARWEWSVVDLETGGPSVGVRGIARGAKGSLWVATREGLWRLPKGFSPEISENWQRYTSDDGLLSTEVNAVWPEANGQLWAGTAGGLSGLDDNGTLEPADDVWVSLTAGDGLVYNRVTALWREASGALWIESGTTETALIRHVPTGYPPALQVTERRSRPTWWSLDVGAKFHGDSLASDALTYRYRLPGKAWARAERAGWVETGWTPAAGDTFTVEAFDRDLNQATLEAVKLDIPYWQRPWGWWWFRLLGYGLVGLGIVYAVGRQPLGRWWRDRQRTGYRETWEVSFKQARPDLPVCTIYAEQQLKRDVRLWVERVRKPQGFDPQVRPVVVDQALPEDLSELHQAWRDAEEPGDLKPLHDLARALSGVLFPERLTRHLRVVLERRGYRVRLRLDFLGALGLAAYPWELAGPPDLEHVGVNLKTAVSRWLPAEEASTDVAHRERPEAVELLERDQRLRLLLVVAAPDMPPAFEGLPQLDIRTEMARIEAVLEGQPVILDKLVGVMAGGERTELAIEEQLAARLRVVEEAPDIVHFIGHAGPPPDGQEDDEIVLYLESEEGDLLTLGAARLVGMIRESQKQSGRPKLLVLNACQTAEVSGGQTLGGLAPLLLTQTGLLAVVGTQYPIGDEASARFSTNFYRELLKTEPLDYAVSRARFALKDELEGRDWAAPVLYMRVADGMIYKR